MKVVYGHTDSIYVKMEDDDVSKAQLILDDLNSHVRKIFPNVMGLEEHPVTIEFEKFYKTLGVGCKKNRNAGLITWKDGEYLDELEFVMTGFTAKRVAITPLAKEVQLEVLDRWVQEQTEEEITNYLHDKYFSVLNGDIHIRMLAQRSRFREERFLVKCSNCQKNKWDTKYHLHELSNITEGKKFPCCNKPDLITLRGKRPTIGSGIEGVLFHNTKHPNDLIDDSYLYLKVSGIHETYFHPLNRTDTIPNYVSAKQLEDLLEYTPNYSHYASSIVSKAEPIYEAMGWDITQIYKDRNQSELEEWF